MRSQQKISFVTKNDGQLTPYQDQLLQAAFYNAQKCPPGSLPSRILSSFLRFTSYATDNVVIFPFWGQVDREKYVDTFIAKGFLGHDLSLIFKKYKSKFWPWLGQFDCTSGVEGSGRRIRINSILLEKFLQLPDLGQIDRYIHSKMCIELIIDSVGATGVLALLENGFWEYLEKLLEEIEVVFRRKSQGFLILEGRTIFPWDYNAILRADVKHNVKKFLEACRAIKLDELMAA